MTNPSVYIIILNYNGYDDTTACLESLKELDYPDYHVITVDNDSPDGSGVRLASFIASLGDSRFEFIESGENCGFAAGNNVGIRVALERGADYIWMLNNDTEVEPDALSQLVAKIESDEHLGIVGSRLMYYHDRERVQGLGGWYSPMTGRAGHITEERDLGSLAYIIGASMLVRAGVFREVGLLTEDYFLYFEELDIAERIRGHYTQGVATGSVVYHRVGASIGDLSDFSSYYLFRNVLRFTWRYHRLYFPTVALVTILRILTPHKSRPYSRLSMLAKVWRSFLAGGVKDY